MLLNVLVLKRDLEKGLIDEKVLIDVIEKKDSIKDDGNDDDYDNGSLPKLNHSFTHGKGIMGSNLDKESSGMRNISPQTAEANPEKKLNQFNAMEMS